MSSANNILISGNSLVVTNKGTYKLDITVIGTPATVSSTVIPTINVNGVAIASASITGGATAVMDDYNVSTITSLNRGDIVTPRLNFVISSYYKAQCHKPQAECEERRTFGVA